MLGLTGTRVPVVAAPVDIMHHLQQQQVQRTFSVVDTEVAAAGVVDMAVAVVVRMLAAVVCMVVVSMVVVRMVVVGMIVAGMVVVAAGTAQASKLAGTVVVGDNC